MPRSRRAQCGSLWIIADNPIRALMSYFDAVHAAPGGHKITSEIAIVRVLDVPIPLMGRPERMHHRRWLSLMLHWETGGSRFRSDVQSAVALAHRIGARPIDLDEAKELIPTHLTLQNELDEYEDCSEAQLSVAYGCDDGQSEARL
jgi:hypothetical protein